MRAASSIRARLGAVVGMAMLILSAACQPVELSREKTWWERIEEENKQGEGWAPARSPTPARLGGAANGVGGEKESEEAFKAVVEHPDGSVTLNAPLPEYLVAHLSEALVEEEYELILDQLVAEEARRAYRDAGRDPAEIADWMRENRRDVVAMLTRMQGGFNAPDVVWHQNGRLFRMQLTGRTAQNMRFTTMDIIRENGQFRLVLIK